MQIILMQCSVLIIKLIYNIFTLPHPERIVIDLKDCRTSIKPDQIHLGLCPVSKVKIGIQNGYDLRLVYDLSQHVNLIVYLCHLTTMRVAN